MREKFDQRSYVLTVLAKTGWSQTDLAKRAGLDPSTLSRFLSLQSGERALRPNTLRRIGVVSGIPANSSLSDSLPSKALAETSSIPYLPESGTDMAEVVAALKRRTPNLDAWILRCRSLELAGYLPFDILLVDASETPLRGDVVCAQLYDTARNVAETVFRIFQPPYLVAATSNLDFVSPSVVGTDSVSIRGVVVSSLRFRGKRHHQGQIITQNT